MPVTKDQAQMLATLAVACRPHRAPTWDHAGVMANIAKVADRSLAEVVLATIRAAADRETKSPGVIPSNGTHWQEQLKPAAFKPERLEPGDRCKTCGLSRDRCERNPLNRDEDLGHAFEADYKRQRETDISDTVTELKGLAHPTPTPAHPAHTRTSGRPKEQANEASQVSDSRPRMDLCQRGRTVGSTGRNPAEH